MDSLRCVVERITYENEENGYSVIKVQVKGFSDLVTAVGNMAGVNVGCILNLRGQWKNDSKYGKQFSVEKWEETLPATVHGIEKYLGSGLIKGIGAQYAKKIVSKFGAETLKVIEETPDHLIQVDGIGKKRVAKIKSAWIEQKEIKNVMVFLTEHGVSTAYAVKIFKTYGDRSIHVVRENPYKLADDIWGIGFKTADKIAEEMGYDKDSAVRCRSGIIHTLNELSGDVHCYATWEQLTNSAAELLEIEASAISTTIGEMLHDKDIIQDKDDSGAICLPPLYYSEVGVANRLAAIQKAPSQKISKNAIKDFDVVLAKLETAQGTPIQYSNVQKEAIKSALLSKALIMTGGPGTGKK